ncbi:hypothetical protein Poli38472_003088 [Pythium oligandrum]|uniref:PDZ domain-containing protein n=1 Tax=Pythium oligandrum TaxID=41045 RepID=A0A8K1FFU5_PYTOL|nr:hypothetical protein Poli38472_003088 [Pythium oligandrum]|eukprot:TMW57163.1 hypothetical protein Poli38472_003088 [Pythium oligandrum]
MNDPFAAFDPINRQKNAATTGSFATLPTPMPLAAPAAGPYNQFQTGMPPAAPYGSTPAANPFGISAAMQQPVMKPYPNGAAFMTQPNAPAFSGLGGYPMQQQQQQPAMNPFGAAPAMPMQNTMPAAANNPFGAQQQPVMYDSIRNLLQPKPADPFATSAGAPPNRPAPLTQQSSTIVDFDPFSPRDNEPRTPFDTPSDRTGSGSLGDRKRQTQDAARNQLGFDSNAFQQASTNANKISLKNLSIQDTATTHAQANNMSHGFDDSPFFSDASDAFAGQTVSNLDDDFFSPPPASAQTNERTSSGGARATGEDAVSEECGPDEYDVTFEYGRKLGVLMERVDVYGKREERRQEVAVVKLVVENGAADRVGVTVGSSVIAINGRSVANDTYTTVLDMIKSAPRPMGIRFKRGTVNKDSTQGNILTRISNGTFSVGNLTSGNATWTQKYFAFGGAKMDVLQLFVSRAAYHECVISLYEKRPVHTQIQSFRLCRDHKISTIKSKIYKGYGNLHYFSLSVPSLRFIAAKFASDDYETLKNIWSHTYDAIERKKRMGY